MRVLMQNRTDSFLRPGGDTLQMMNTKAALESLGVEVTVDVTLEPALRGYDIIHLFNLDSPRDTFLQFANARRHSLPVALSPIYHKLDDYYDKGLPFPHSIARKFSNRRLFDLTRDAAKAARGLHSWTALRRTAWRSVRRLQAEVVNAVDLILPNSELERQAVLADFRPAGAIRVVYNGVESETADSAQALLHELPQGPFVVCVARLEPRKNQLALVRALAGTGLPLVLVGRESASYPAYSRTVLRELESNGGKWIRETTHAQVMSILQRAKVHALPSWFETCSLVSIEAQTSGCNVVCTDRGYAREYLGENGWYCDAADLASIRDACRQAFRAPRMEPSAPRFTWAEAGRGTLEAYRLLKPS